MAHGIFLTKYPGSLIRGLPFAATLLGILVTHELGHYVLSRIHRVPASLPLFIPGPPSFHRNLWRRHSNAVSDYGETCLV